MIKRKISSIILMFALIICSLITSSKVSLASTNKEEATQLNAKLAVDDTFEYYISTSDTEKGVLISSGTLRQVVTSSYQLTKGNKYYIHIECKDLYGVISAFIGRFDLNGTGFKFKDGSNVLITDLNSFKVSRTGFGQDYEAPTLCNYNQSDYASINQQISPAKWIWTNYGKDFYCTRYFSAEIIPDSFIPSPSITATATGTAISVDLNWTSVENAISYSVKRSTTQGGPYTAVATDLTTNSYVDKNVIAGTTYYYVITAKLSDTESINSNEVSASPLKEINVLKLVLEKNEVKQLSVSEELSDNTNLTWVSSNPAVATVDANGKVKALKPGNTVITCTSADGEYTDKINVLVVDLNYQLAVDLTIGDKCRLTVDDLKDTTKVTWTVNDPSIATVSNKGRVAAVGEGLTFVTATDEAGKIIGQIYIRVRQ